MTTATEEESPMEATRAPAWTPPQRGPGAWRHRSYLELGAYPTAPGSARGHTINVLREWALGQFTEAAEIVVSELVTNAVQATRATPWPAEQAPPPVRLWLLSDGAGILVRVWDALPWLPAPRETGPDDESGRGLAIVASLCSKWGHDSPPRETGGKITWALITTPWS
jgi:hypothetical protein